MENRRGKRVPGVVVTHGSQRVISPDKGRGRRNEGKILFHLCGDYSTEMNLPWFRVFLVVFPAVISPDAKAEKNYSDIFFLSLCSRVYAHAYTHTHTHTHTHTQYGVKAGTRAVIYTTCSASGDSARISFPLIRCGREVEIREETRERERERERKKVSRKSGCKI